MLKIRGVALLFALLGVLMFASSAHAADWCNGRSTLDDGIAGWKDLSNWRCVASSGSGSQVGSPSSGGYELAYFIIRSNHPEQNGTPVPGCWHVSLTDNGYTMANSQTWCNPMLPVVFGSPWIYHPYWGTYCSHAWIQTSPSSWKESGPAACAYTDGYQ
jgi:hypothetical protein